MGSELQETNTELRRKDSELQQKETELQATQRELVEVRECAEMAGGHHEVEEDCL